MVPAGQEGPEFSGEGVRKPASIGITLPPAKIQSATFVLWHHPEL